MKMEKKKSTYSRAKIFFAVFLFVFIAVFFKNNIVTAEGIIPGGEETMIISPPTEKSQKAFSGFEVPSAWKILSAPITYVLKLILSFVGVILGIAVTLFEWIVDPDIVTTLIGNPSIYTMWIKVRDLFNFLFIMVLLFSAFATVFQISKYNYQKIVLHLVLMALLVNFSFPIARFLIDVSNVLMYELINQTGANNLVNQIMASTQIEKYAKADGETALYLLSAIIFVFIFSITLLVIGVLLLIRVITLTIYLIFSPIAFVGSILPGTKLASVADDWWRDFLKYCFSGPTMIFMVYIASELIKITANFKDGIETASSSHVPTGLTPLIVAGIMCSIPVIVLWFGIITAQKSGLAGANAVAGAGKKFLKNTGMKLSGADFAKKQYAAYSAERKKRTEEEWKNPIGAKLGRKVNQYQDRLYGNTERADKMKSEYDFSQVKEATESQDMANKGTNELRNVISSGNKYTRAAAIQELINRNSFDMNDLRNRSAYQNMRNDFGTSSKTFNAINNKLKASDPVSAFAHITDPTERQNRIREYVQSNQFDARKLGANSLADQTFMETAFREGAISNADLDELRKKSPIHNRNIQASLGAIAGNFDMNALREQRNEQTKGSAEWIALDDQLATARKVHIAHLAQTGGFHNSITTPADRIDIIQRLNSDSAKRINAKTTGDEKILKEIAENIPAGRYKSIITSMEDINAQRAINGFFRNPDNRPGGASGASGANGAEPEAERFDRIAHTIQIDPDLSRI